MEIRVRKDWEWDFVEVSLEYTRQGVGSGKVKNVVGGDVVIECSESTTFTSSPQSCFCSHWLTRRV